MITETIYFDLPAGISRDELLAKYRQTASAWSTNEDLVYKFYFFDETRNVGGGVYVWKTLEAAKHWHGAEYQARVKEVYGSEVQITHHDTLLVVDNINRDVSEPTRG
ncbi:YdhR family protein [Variovorax sp. EL159]|uniref:YdhR family protein n=1 Tax=Variovorax sp. EL159 TaxID=1566270 RepID=UPI00088D65A0|nr:YdhR family protein [Variovorax sp. EL159]SCX61716.1 hypothetical protein SAMN03159363_2329 [Variovorax sp. EL159]